MEMGWGTDKDEKGKKGGCTMTQTKDTDIPNHKAIHEEISAKSESVIQALKNKFKYASSSWMYN